MWFNREIIALLNTTSTEASEYQEEEAFRSRAGTAGRERHWKDQDQEPGHYVWLDSQPGVFP